MQSERQSTSVSDAEIAGITSTTWQDLDYEDAVEASSCCVNSGSGPGASEGAALSLQYPCEVPDDSIRASVDGLAFPSDEETRAMCIS